MPDLGAWRRYVTAVAERYGDRIDYQVWNETNVIGYWTGRFGEATTRSSAHPLLIAVVLASAGFTLGSAVLHFMLGLSIPASQLFLGVLLPGLAFNLILAYPIYSLCAKVLPPRLVVRREVKPAV